MGVGIIRGIIIEEKPHKETSKYIVVLAKGIGKVRLSAKGARRTKSPLMAGTQLFSYCDFTVYEGRGFGSVTQVDIIESFYGLRNDVAALSQAVYMAETLSRTCPDGLEQDEVLHLFLYTLQVLAKGSHSPTLIGRIFELKFLQLSGVLGELVCSDCMQRDAAMYFDMIQADFLCSKHHHADDILLYPAAVEAMDYVCTHEGRELFSFGLSPQVLAQLTILLERYLQVHMGLDLKSRQFALDMDKPL